MDDIHFICSLFFNKLSNPKIQAIKGGLINTTFKLDFENENSFILQKINQSVFKEPDLVMNNIQKTVTHLSQNDYPLTVLQPISSTNKKLIEKDSFGNFWRAFPFIEDTKVFSEVSHPRHAFEAAKAFGLFIKYLTDIDLNCIYETIPNFHNLDYRFKIFQNACNIVDNKLREKAKLEIEKIQKLKDTLKFNFHDQPLRVVHNDTKISNILFDENDEAVCVIDLDTIMPGLVIFDFGDMIRTICCNFSEEERDIKKIEIEVSKFEALTKGFSYPMKNILTDIEKENLVNGGIYIIFEQAIRFLTDYLQGDIYYSKKYPDQNLIRAKNQLQLLQSILFKKKDMELITSELF